MIVDLSAVISIPCNGPTKRQPTESQLSSSALHGRLCVPSTGRRERRGSDATAHGRNELGSDGFRLAVARNTICLNISPSS
ncbi:MAG TPA: hypothetical protein VN741_13475, partial [Mycobacterium sp.]|nr:hypothetical protein [Mycobacterium sp.]